MIFEGTIPEQLGILLISSVKFIVGAPASYMLGYSWLQTILSTSFGGWIGVLVFYYAGRTFFARFPLWKKIMRRFYHNVLGVPLRRRVILKQQRTPPRTFSRLSRLLVRIRTRYGFPGLIILTPVLLSIPLGTFLMVKYYSHRRGLLGWLSLSVVGWSVVIASLIKIF